MPARPLSLAVASGLVALIGVGVGLVGLLLVAVATGGIPFLDSAGGIVSVVGLLGLIAIALAVAGVVSAVALWQRRAWGWAASLAMSIAGVIGAVVALDSSGAQAPIQLGLATTLAAAVLLVVPGTRRAAGIG